MCLFIYEDLIAVRLVEVNLVQEYGNIIIILKGCPTGLRSVK